MYIRRRHTELSSTAGVYRLAKLAVYIGCDHGVSYSEPYLFRQD